MKVLVLAPSYPPEQQQFTRGLAEVGATIYGVGDGPLDPAIRHLVTDYLQLDGSIMDDAGAEAQILRWLRGKEIDRVLSNWEPVQMLMASIREKTGIPGMLPDAVAGFRDKVLMRQRVEAAGLRMPRTRRARTRAEVWEAAEFTGYPLVIKPVDGAGGRDTWRCDSPADLERAIGVTGHVPEASVEEWITGEEFTYETLSIEGRPVLESICQYFPNVLDARKNEWISPVIASIRDQDQPRLRGGSELGRKVLQALGMHTGFSHMEWFLNDRGEAIFGEVACRAPGASMVDLMNYTYDEDFFREWARVACWHAYEGRTERRWNVGMVFKRAMGQGRIAEILGVEHLHHMRRWLARVDLLPIGAQRRDWTRTFLSDGNITVRHPDWDTMMEMVRTVQTRVHLIAR